MPGNSPPSIQSPLLAVTHRADALKFFDFRANVKILPRNFRAFYHTIVRKPYAYRANFNASALPSPTCDVDKIQKTGDSERGENSDSSTSMAAQSDGRFLEAADHVRKGALTDA